MMIIEKEKMFKRQKNAGIVSGESAFIGIFARGVNKLILFIIKEKQNCISPNRIVIASQRTFTCLKSKLQPKR